MLVTNCRSHEMLLYLKIQAMQLHYQGCPVFRTKCSSQKRSNFSYQCQQHFSNSPTTMCFTAIHNFQPPRLVSRSGQLQEQGFSVEVAEKIDALQRSSTRTIYKSKWAQTFFISLYRDVNRHPSTIDGYGMATVDILGPAGLHISQSSDLNSVLSSFHRDCDKSSRNLPKWNLSVVLNELSKAPFEPMNDTDLKHLSLKLLSC